MAASPPDDLANSKQRCLSRETIFLAAAVMAETGPSDKLRIFISYSRKDTTEFADELVAGLEVAGFDPFLDREDIAAGEDWEQRLGNLIEQADTIVFVISPEALRSKRCEWEIDKTLALSKRLLPVIFKTVSIDDIPEPLRRLQFVDFSKDRESAAAGTSRRSPAAKYSNWIREHTRLGDLAGRWQSRNRSESMLLREDDLVLAKTWVANRKSDAPEITKLQRAFINASDAAETAHINKERQRLDEMRRAQEARARSRV